MKFTCFLLFSLCSLCCFAQATPVNGQHMSEEIASATKKDTITIAVLLYNSIVLEDFAGPMEVFSKAQQLTQGGYKTFTVAFSPEVIHTENGLLKIAPDFTLDNFPKADYLLIPGASMLVINKLREDKRLTTFLQTWAKQDSSYIFSVCTAAYLLANAGILDHKNATTHYFVADDFEEQFPQVTLVRNVRYIADGRVITSSGVTSGIDAALYIVGKNSGEKLQGMINRALQYSYGTHEKWPVAPHGMRYRSK